MATSLKNISIISALVLGLTLVVVSGANAGLTLPAPRAITPRVSTSVTSSSSTNTTTQTQSNTNLTNNQVSSNQNLTKPTASAFPTRPVYSDNSATVNSTTVNNNISSLNVTSNADCVINTTILSGTKYCVDSTHIYGNFSQDVINACKSKNGGQSCSAIIKVETKNGKTSTTYRYNYNFYKTFAK